MTYTPGPWHFNGRRITTGAFIVADIWNADEPIGQANAHLISASPDVLDALKDCRNELFKRIDRLTADMPDDVRQKYLQFPPVVKADAAIAKAEGRQP